MVREISDDRKALYYVGLVMVIIGVLVFFSTFITSAVNFGNFDNFQNRSRGMFLTAIVGMGLIMVGNVIRVIGSRGWAGSGVVLDPQQARQDLEPYSRMVGGMAKDTLDEMGMNFDANRSQSDLANDEPRVKIRCRSCQQLSDETARFCSNCGHAL